MVHLQIELIKWYDTHKRDLPWRHTKDPYKIWLSEIILQQTRVAQGLSYYHKFISTHPNVTSLARASEEEVLSLWKGLGYYSRARNLHKTARQVQNEFKGKFPNSYDGLIKLTGIGPYTAAAISSFCYDEQKAVVDGNVFRVLSRLYDVDTPINTTQGQKEFVELASAALNKEQPAKHNQAIMEFGALQCVPKNPQCPSCPFIFNCLSQNKGTVGQRPQKIKKIKKKNRFLLYKVYFDRKNKKVFLKKRIEKDIWFNLYDFHLTEYFSLEEFEETIRKKKTFRKKHLLTHQTLHVAFLLEEATGIKEELKPLKPYSMDEAKELPMPVIHEKYILEQLGFLD
tara:strand:+ start:394 stop:1416 length:1023 start_codon:yes stop_codon:yes gene_type:complete